MQVYLPAGLYERLKASSESLNVSSVLQHALEEALAEVERRKALDLAVRAFESKHGPLGAAEIARQEERDRVAARRPRPRRRVKKKAA